LILRDLRGVLIITTKKSVRRIRFIGDCHIGQFTAYSKTGKKIGYLQFESNPSATDIWRAAIRALRRSGTYDSKRLREKWLRVNKIVVLPKYEGRGTATLMYSELCKFITEQCPIITTVSGTVLSKSTLKARTKVFGVPRRIRWQDPVKIEEDENYNEEFITYEQAMKLLPQRVTTKSLELIAHASKSIDVLSNAKGCRILE